MNPREASWVEVELIQNCGESRSKLETLISIAAVELGQNWILSSPKDAPSLEKKSEGSFSAKIFSEDL